MTPLTADAGDVTSIQFTQHSGHDIRWTMTVGQQPEGNYIIDRRYVEHVTDPRMTVTRIDNDPTRRLWLVSWEGNTDHHWANPFMVSHEEATVNRRS